MGPLSGGKVFFALICRGDNTFIEQPSKPLRDQGIVLVEQGKILHQKAKDMARIGLAS